MLRVKPVQNQSLDSGPCFMPVPTEAALSVDPIALEERTPFRWASSLGGSVCIELGIDVSLKTRECPFEMDGGESCCRCLDGDGFFGRVYIDGGSELLARKEDIDDEGRLIVWRALFRLLSIS